MKNPRIYLYFVFIFCFLLTSLRLHSEPIKRTILALYDSADEPAEDERDRIYRFAPMVLNYLGMKMKYHDVNQGLPDESSMKDVHGILTWFRDDTMRDAEKYLSWLRDQILKGVKVVILEENGAEVDVRPEIDPTTKKSKLEELPSFYVDRVFNALGLQYKGQIKELTYLVEITKLDPSMMNFERNLRYKYKSYVQVVSNSPINKVYLKGHLRGRKESETDLVVTTPQGGYAASGSVVEDETEDPKQKGWFINPFKFFSEAFDIKYIPRPDVTTVTGNRVFYAHIDGDGFNNISHIDRKTLSGEIVYQHILKKYQIPHTVSVIVGEIDPAVIGADKSLKIAREILALPYVEAASHGYGHPFDWIKRDVGVTKLTQKFGYKRADYEKEIRYSVDWINQNLLTPPKKVPIFLWTGDCNPPVEALRIPYDMGIKNLNGGDSQFDVQLPTLLGVAPLTRHQGNYAQIYTSNANENIYTNLWTGPFDGLKGVVETFKNTDSPRRLAAMDIYYHFYSGERWAAVKGLEKAYDYALSQPIFPVYATDYVSFVEGFLSTEIAAMEEGWNIRNNGNLRTVRFDETELYPDFEKSLGILGFIHYQKSLYIYLDEKSDHKIILKSEKPRKIYLIQSNVKVLHWILNTSNLSFQIEGIVPAVITLANMISGKTYSVVIGNTTLAEKADASGQLTFRFDLRKSEKVTIRL